MTTIMEEGKKETRRRREERDKKKKGRRRREEGEWNRIENAASYIPPHSKMESVKDFWEGNDWRPCPQANNRIFQIIWDELHSVKLDQIGREDKILWKSSSGKEKPFTLKEGWESCRNRGPEVAWDKAIWFSSNIPKHSFVSWRACLDALPTADQLQKRNIDIPQSCRLCENGIDTNLHLFFECEFSSSIWKSCMSRCIPRVGRSSSCVIEASRLATTKGKGCHISSIPKIMFNAIIYIIWKERNHRSFGGKKNSKEVVSRETIHQIEVKVSSMSFKKPENQLEFFLCTKWNIDVH